MTPSWMFTRPWRVVLVALVLAAGAGPVRAGGPTLSPEQDPLVRDMDTSVSPGADFFKYACGRWIKDNPIPESERGWGIANLVNEETYRQRLEICQDAARSKAAKGTNEQKIGDFWSTGMDSVTIDSTAKTVTITGSMISIVNLHFPDGTTAHLSETVPYVAYGKDGGVPGAGADFFSLRVVYKDTPGFDQFDLFGSPATFAGTVVSGGVAVR